MERKGADKIQVESFDSRLLIMMPVKDDVDSGKEAVRRSSNRTRR
jgi:hypothetical protein